MKVIKLREDIHTKLLDPERGVLINRFEEDKDGFYISDIPKDIEGKFIKMTLTPRLVTEMMEDGRATLISETEDVSK